MKGGEGDERQEEVEEMEKREGREEARQTSRQGGINTANVLTGKINQCTQ